MSLSFQCYLKRGLQLITVKIVFSFSFPLDLDLASLYAIIFTEVLAETGPTQTQKPVTTHSDEKITDSIKR